MSQHRKHRGYETQRIVADYLRTHGWPYAEPVGAGRPGSDITGIPGIDVECKARRKLDLTGTIRQQSERAGDGVVPLAIIRPDGFGPKRIDDWPVVMPLHVAVRLLREGGYGNAMGE
jgi:hypothetical protein